MSNQRLFDESLKHIRKQKQKSYCSDICKCRYRLKKEGKELSCAFAPAIKEYDLRMESRSASWFYPIGIDNISQVGLFGDLTTIEGRLEFLHEWAHDVDLDLPKKIQEAHDLAFNDEYFLSNFELKMEQIAKEYNLEYSKPE